MSTIENQLNQMQVIYQTIPKPIKEYTIHTGSKWRKVYDPVPELKTILKDLNQIVTDYYQEKLKALNLTDNAQAYLPEKSIKTNANQHKNSPVLIKFDFSGFYDSVKLDYFLPDLEDLADRPLTEDDRKVLTHCLINPKTGGLTQGLPVSGALAGLSLIPFWQTLKAQLPENIHFTQYSDDLTLSLKQAKRPEDYPIEFDVPVLEAMIQGALANNHLEFKINEKKTTVQKRQYRKVTGVTLNHNNQLTIKRKDYRWLRAFLHRLRQSNDLDQTLKQFKLRSKQSLTGKVSHMRQLDESGKINRLLNQYAPTLLNHQLFTAWLKTSIF